MALHETESSTSSPNHMQYLYPQRIHTLAIHCISAKTSREQASNQKHLSVVNIGRNIHAMYITDDFSHSRVDATWKASVPCKTTASARGPKLVMMPLSRGIRIYCHII